ncbi:MAG: hypothetical protein ACTMIC_02710, partial [Cellulosimicrobium funkei]
METSVHPSLPTPRRRPARRRSVAVALVAGMVGTAALATSLPAAAAEPDLPDGAWVDTFDGAALGPDWTVVNPVPEALSVGGGKLTLTSQPGDTYQDANSAKNVVLLDVPAGDFTVVTRLEAPVASVYQGAGLVAWQDMDNYVRSGLTFVG